MHDEPRDRPLDEFEREQVAIDPYEDLDDDDDDELRRMPRSGKRALTPIEKLRQR